MFSALGPLFKTVFRETEHADARLEIRREEKENSRKNRGRDESAVEDNSLWEDTTGVSVTALRTFLVEFLKEKGLQTDAPNTHTPSKTLQAAAPNPASVSPEAARAIKAYGSMASQNHYLPPEPLKPEPAEDLASLLESDEIRMIHRLIEELDILSRAGVETLSFQMNGAFLESVSEAVRIQKSLLGV